MPKKVPLNRVCRPPGPKYGDAPSVGYELPHEQVTRAQAATERNRANLENK